MINFLISVSVAKVKVFIKKFMSSEECTFWSLLSSGNFERIIVILSKKRGSRKSCLAMKLRYTVLLTEDILQCYDKYTKIL